MDDATGRRVLTFLERLAVQAAARDLAAAQEQMAAVVAALGLDPARAYTLDGDALVPRAGAPPAGA